MFLTIDSVVPGMKTARDVVNLNGAILLPSGVLLSEDVLQRLKTWGVKGIHVEGDGPEANQAPPEVSAEVLRQAESAVDRRFRHVPQTHAFTKRIREIAVRRTAQRLLTEPRTRPSQKV